MKRNRVGELMFLFERNKLISDVITGLTCLVLSVNSTYYPVTDSTTAELTDEASSCTVESNENVSGVQVASVYSPVGLFFEVERDSVISKSATEQYIATKRQRAENYRYQLIPQQTLSAVNVDEGQLIADIAESMVGTPYMYAGESEAGVDCSGLVVYCYAQLGIDLPHSSYSMCNVGEEVSVDDIRPGDIICWDNQGGSCGHVGIYIGDGMMVDARGSNEGVIYGDLDLHPILTVRRIFN